MMISKRKVFFLVLLLLTLLFSACGPSLEEQDMISIGQTAVAATPCPEPKEIDCNCADILPLNMETRLLVSEHTGRNYNLYISLPLEYNFGTRDYAVIYVLDGDLLFGTTKEAVHALTLGGDLRDHIVVAIGYDTNNVNDAMEYRFQEFDPQSVFSAKYTKFLLEEVIPLIEQNYRVDPAVRTLLGHSLSGLFPLDLMFEYPDTFNKIVAMSPSLWFNYRGIFSVEEEFSQISEDLPVDLYLSVGELEEDPEFSMVSNLVEFADLLESREYPGLTIILDIIEGENHNSVIPFSTSRGIRAVND